MYTFLHSSTSPLCFAGFVPDDSASLKDEFARLARFRNWKLAGKKYREEWAKFAVSEFKKHYDAEAPKLESWQSLCREIGIEGDLASITKCRKV
jgi:hypothetical protein